MCSVFDKLATKYDKIFRLTLMMLPHYLAKSVFDKLKWNDVNVCL